MALTSDAVRQAGVDAYEPRAMTTKIASPRPFNSSLFNLRVLIASSADLTSSVVEICPLPSMLYASLNAPVLKWGLRVGS